MDQKKIQFSEHRILCSTDERKSYRFAKLFIFSWTTALNKTKKKQNNVSCLKFTQKWAFQNKSRIQYLNPSRSTSLRKRKPPHMDTNQIVRQDPVSGQNNKNSLKMINIIDPVTWNNQDLHPTTQDTQQTSHYKVRECLDCKCRGVFLQTESTPNHFVLE